MQVACWTELCCRLIWAVVGGRGQQADGGDEAATGAGSGQAMAEAVKAGAWAATSAVGAGEAVAVAACWLVGVLADDGDGDQQDERPGSPDPGFVEDEKWRQ
ncbi:hypothetical protein ACLOJK_004994, partial [Asimina triloba]